MEPSVGGEAIIDIPEAKMEQMQQVVEVILMAQRAKAKELLAVKAGLNAAFGDDWRSFKPSRRLSKNNQTTENQQESAPSFLQITETIATQKSQIPEQNSA